MKTIFLGLFVLAVSACTVVQNPTGSRNIRGGGIQEEVADYGYVQNIRRLTLQRIERPGATGAVVGAVTGAAIGNQFGNGNGKKASTIAGGVIGAAIGNSIAEQNAPRVNVPGLEIAVRISRTNELVTVTQEQYRQDTFFVGQPVKIVYPQNIALVVPLRN